MPKYNSVVVVCARWENEYIVEWIEYYKRIGYGHIFLYCNDDDPSDMFKLIEFYTYGKDPFVTFCHFGSPGLQYQMYMHFIRNFASSANWVSFFDVDEFLRISNGLNISRFLEKFEDDCDCILFNWRVFGTNGHTINPGGKVLEQYTKCAAGLSPYTKVIAKSLVLLDQKLLIPEEALGFWHSLYGKLYKPIKIVNAIGSTQRKENYVGLELESLKNSAVLHHYFMKSEQYRSHRILRGLYGVFQAQSIWNQENQSQFQFLNLMEEFNAEEDLSLANFWQTEKTKRQFHSVFPLVRGVLLSKNQLCTQSSLGDWSKNESREIDATCVVNGFVNGEGKNHTNIELNPWWEVDLGRICRVDQIIIYNSAFNKRPLLQNFCISGSIDNLNQTLIFECADPFEAGDLLSYPFVHFFNIPINLRFLKITVLGVNFLHLDQVEVYGNTEGSDI